MNMQSIYPEPCDILMSSPKITDTKTNRIFTCKNSSAAIFIFFTLIFICPKNITAQCTVPATVCDSLLNLSIDENCMATVNANTIIKGLTSISADCQDVLKVALKNMNDEVIFEGAQITFNAGDFNYPSVGDQFQLQVFFDLNMNDKMDVDEMNSCWGLVNIEDKFSPVVMNCVDVTVYCYEDISPTGNVVPKPIFNDNCSLINITPSILDTIVEYDCHATGFTGPFDIRAKITRTYTATDASGNSSTCSQMITVKRLPLVATNVTAPANVSLECNNANPPNIAASNTGYPSLTFDNNGTVTIELNPTTLSNYCSDLIVSYEDTPLDVSGCINKLKEKYLRKFTIVDCCNNVTVTDIFQTISIQDTTAPSITCPANLTVSSSTNSCLGNTFLPAATTSDACSNVTVSVSTPNGVLNSNGGFVSNLPLGTTTVTYTATDECGNTSTCMMDVTVQDLILPTVICDGYTVVGLNNAGIVFVNADVFDDGSYDNCGPLTFEARRMTDNCGSPNNLIYRPYIEVCCADVGTTIMVQMQVIDGGGNSSSCMVELEVQDKMNPTIICPSDKTIECSNDFTDFNLTGQAIGFDNCGTATITNSDVVNVDPQCGIGTVVRTWTATDAAGRTSSCVQTITMENPSPFTGDTNPLDTDDIQWPADFMGVNAISCTNYLSDLSLIEPSNTGEPVIVGATQGCDMVLIAEPEDETFINNGIGKILRTWTVIDWCQYDPSNPSAGGSWTHTQTIKISDLTAPVLINPPVDFTVGTTDANCQQATFAIPTIAQGDISDCSSNVTISVSGDLGSGSSATAGIGNYTVTYTLTDAAGNTTVHNITVTIETGDTAAPNIVCQNLSAPLMPGDNILTLSGRDFLTTSTTDNCTTYDDLSVAIRFANQPTNGPPTEPDITFTCDHRGVNNVVLWVCDQSNNCYSCSATMTITDPSMSCPSGPMPLANISGEIDNEFGEGIEDVEVMVNNGLQMEMTGASGSFMIENLPLNETYTFSPEKNTDPRNGVTTFDVVQIQKHILGSEFLDSPYKIIAADANGSETITTFDLVVIRNMILLNIDEFPNDVPSWRFVDADYEFPNPTNPFIPEFPEEYVIQSLTEDMTDMNFVSVKIGDVNGSALPALTSSDTRDRVGDLIFTADDQLIQKGDKGILQIFSDDIVNLEAWQFSLTYETHYLQILNLEKNENVYIGSSMLENGTVTACWNNNEMLRNNTPWLQIQFLANEDVYLSDVIELNSDYTKAEAYDVRGELFNVALHFLPTNKTQKPNGKEFILYQNSPNPFTDETVIAFHLPEADMVSLKVYNISGEMIYDSERNFDAGEGRLTLLSKELSSTGMLYYTVETTKYHATQRMILLKN